MSENKINPEFDEHKGKLMEDHEYDGIRELDNPPPPWWNWLFYLTIAWSAYYMLNYHVFNTGDNQDQEYAKELAAQQATMKPAVAFDEANITLVTDVAKLEAAKGLFATKTCITCHGPNGEGNQIGPNLCDSFAIHGYTPAEVFKVIKYGVPTKGMTPFKDQLTNDQILDLTSYVLTKLYGTTPANAKAPQGDKIGSTAVVDTTNAAATPNPAEEAQKTGEMSAK